MPGELPPAGRGWEILNEMADRLPADSEARADFIAFCRDAEGAFTSGYISEDAYVKLLTKVFAEEERRL